MLICKSLPLFFNFDSVGSCLSGLLAQLQVVLLDTLEILDLEVCLVELSFLLQGYLLEVVEFLVVIYHLPFLVQDQVIYVFVLLDYQTVELFVLLLMRSEFSRLIFDSLL